MPQYRIKVLGPGSEGEVTMNLTPPKALVLERFANAFNDANPDHSAPWISVILLPEAENGNTRS